MTISVDAEAGVNEFIEPGDRINVLVTLDVEIDLGNTSDSVTGDFGTEADPAEEIQVQLESRTISRFAIQGLPVLAVGEEIRADADEPETIEVTNPAATTEETQNVRVGLLTLEVSPEQAERLAFVWTQGVVWLTLVPTDFVETPTDGVTLCTLFPDLVALAEEFPGLESACADN
jgi:Flp pilus assembly protein CpaB